MKKVRFGIVLIGIIFILAGCSNGSMKPGIETVLVEGGTFEMGSPTTEAGRDTDEIQHSVTVGSFYISKYEVTQESV